MKTGALIVATSRISRYAEFSPLTKIGSITMVKRLAQTLRQAGCHPIVLLTRDEEEELEHHVSRMGVIYIRDAQFNPDYPFQSMKLGLDYIKEFCDRLVAAPIDVPMVTSDTLCQVMGSKAVCAAPCYCGERGYPLLVRTEALERIMEYNGTGDLISALEAGGYDITMVEVEDRGVVVNGDMVSEMECLLVQHNQQLYSITVSLRIQKEDIFFGPGTAQLLSLVESCGSIKEACGKMKLSYTKGWTIINRAEEQLGYEILQRKHGGKAGRRTTLTDQGKSLLERYNQLEKEVRAYTLESFDRIFPEYN